MQDAGAEADGANACNLHKSGVMFSGACDTCMQASCCAPTVACFSGNADCAALHACLAMCPVDPMSRVILVGGSGDGGVDDPCRTACAQAHPGSVDAEHVYDMCIRSTCKADCAT